MEFNFNQFQNSHLVQHLSNLLSDHTILEHHTSPDRHSHQYVVQGRPSCQSHHLCDSCSIFRSSVFQAHIYIRQASQSNLNVSSSARPYLHMLGLPNPTSFERRLICVTPDMYGMSTILEILPDGAN